MPTPSPLTGLVAATYTPFHADGSLNLAAVESYARHLLVNRVATVFIGGTTGESHSLTLEERRARAVRWTEVARGTALRLVQVLAKFGYLGATKALMGLLGVEVGPARLPLTNPSADQLRSLRADLDALGFFDWIKP